MQSMTCKFAMTVSLIGALNWGVVGATSLWWESRFDLVDWIGLTAGSQTVADIIYIVIGLSAVIVLMTMRGR